MKLVIEAEGVKREIIGPYALCASREDLKLLDAALTRWLSGTSTFGWCDIVELPRSTANTPPMPWIIK